MGKLAIVNVCIECVFVVVVVVVVVVVEMGLPEVGTFSSLFPELKV